MLSITCRLCLASASIIMSPEPNSPGDARWTLMFRELKKEVAKPSTEHPTARVWRQSDLTSVITNIHKREMDELKSTFPPAKDVIARMLDIGWIQKISLESNTDKKPPSLFLLDMEATEEEFPEPWELLQAFKPAGIICYLGAASFHELTTQVPTFYHIANLRTPSPSYNPEEVQPSETGSNQMAKHLKEIGRQDWSRRVGAMLSIIDGKAEGELQNLLEESSNRVTSGEVPLALMPGLPATNLIKQWGILTP